MSKKVAVRTLQSLALEELATAIVSALGRTMQRNFDLNQDNDMAFVIVEINGYLDTCGAISAIYEDLLRVILGSDSLEASIRFTSLQMLLNESVQTLVTEIFPFSYYEKILQVIAAQGHGIRHLNLKGVWVKEDAMHYMHEILKNLPNLTTLTVPFIATDDLLQWVARYTPKMRVLDVSGETDITDIGIEALAQSPCAEHLVCVDIGSLGDENIASEDVALLLENLPNLLTLKSYSFTGRALRHIYRNSPSFRCKLRYVHDTQTTAETLEAIASCCPELESIYLDTPEEGNLMTLAGLPLRKLKLYKFQCSELYQLLRVAGKWLNGITLIKGRGTLELGKVIDNCPEILEMQLYMMDMLSYTSDKTFDRLQGLELLSSPLHSWSLKYLICNTPTLKRIAVDSVNFSDEDMHYIVLEHDFKYLEDIWFTSAQNLSIATCEILIERLPELHSLGQLSGWNLTPDDVILLKGLLKSRNSSVVLSPANIFP